MNARHLLLMALVSVLALAGCSSSGPLTASDNYAYLYGKRSAGLRLAARVYHPAPERSLVYFKLRTADLLYKSGGQGAPFRAQVLLRYVAYAPDMRTVLDSASTMVRDQSEQPNANKELIGTLEMRGAGQQKDLMLLITAHDINRDIESSLVLNVHRGDGGRQDFLPLDSRGVPLFDDHMDPGTALRVLCEQHAGKSLWVGHYAPLRQLPRPIFTESGAAPAGVADSTFLLNVGADGRFDLVTPAKGFFHLQVDTASDQGYTIFTMDESYPEVSSGADLVGPLRYITSNQEWERITASPQPRKEVERFWLDAAGDRERAREAIKTYYSRVESADRYFTSSTEGWRTDRGLVHIIFGYPNTIRRTDNGEVWIYGEESNLMSMALTFTRRPGPFSGNDFVLRRDPQFKSAWYRNVESWRNGRVMQN